MAPTEAWRLLFVDSMWEFTRVSLCLRMHLNLFNMPGCLCSMRGHDHASRMPYNLSLIVRTEIRSCYPSPAS